MTSKHLTLLAKLSVKNNLLLEIGSTLKDLKTDEAYKDAVGAGVDTWHQYLSQPEVGMTVNEANYLISAYDLWRSIPDLVDVPERYWKLVLGQELSEELIESAKTLSYQDLKERLYDVKTEDKGPRTYSYMVMRRCNETGNMTKVPLIESDEVKDAFSERFELYGQ